MATNDRGLANVNPAGEPRWGEHPYYGFKAEQKVLWEETTIAASAYTDTTIQIPANCRLDGVAWYVTADVPTTDSTMDIGISGSTTAYADDVDSDAGDTGVKHVATEHTSAASIRITPCSTPTAATGKIRVAIFYTKFTAPTQ